MAKREGGAAREAIPADIRKMTFEEALRSLEEIVQRLESGEVDLEESIEIYSRGTQLKRHCEAKLRAAQERVEKIVSESEGRVGTDAFDAE